MTQDEQRHPSSFFRVEPEDIGLALMLDEQKPVYKSQYQENWSCAWAPDSSYVAWSQGGGIVYLLPWAKDEGCLVSTPASNRSNGNSVLQTDQSELIIQNLPRLSSSIENTDNGVHTTENKDERRSYRIDTGEIVWSMAFGSGISNNSGTSLWRRFNFKHDLILATGLQSGKIKLWHVYTGNLLMELLDHKGVARSLSFTSDGSLKLVSCSNDCTIKFWDLNCDGNMYKTLRFESKGMVFGCKWSPNCKQVAAVGTNKCAYIWNVKDFKSYKKLSGHLHNVTACDFSPDGAILATSSFDTRVLLWDTCTGDIIRTLRHLFPAPSLIYAGGDNGHYVRGLSFSRNGQQLATVADDGYARFWSIDNTKNPDCIAESQKVLSCSYSPNGHVLAVGTRNGLIQFHRPVQSPVSLQHLCRITVRQLVTTEHVDHLHFPLRLKEFLKYKDIVI